MVLNKSLRFNLNIFFSNSFYKKPKIKGVCIKETNTKFIFKLLQLQKIFKKSTQININRYINKAKTALNQISNYATIISVNNMFQTNTQLNYRCY